MIKCLLVGRVSLLKIIHHEIAVTETAPDVAIGRVNFQNSAQVLYSLWERVLCAQDARDSLHGWHRPLIVLKRELVALHGAVEVLHLF